MNHADSVLGWRLVRPLAPRNGCEEWIGVADLEAPKLGSEHWQGFAVPARAQSMERRRIVIAEGSVAVELMREMELRERMRSDFIERAAEYGFFERSTAAAVFTMTDAQPLGRLLAEADWNRGAAVSLLAPLAEVIETAHECDVTGISVAVEAIEVDAHGQPRVAGLFGAQQCDPHTHRAKWDLARAEDARTLGITAAAVLARVRETENEDLEAFVALDALVTAMVERHSPRDAVARLGELLFDFAVPEPLPQLPTHQPAASGPAALRETWNQANIWPDGTRIGERAQTVFEGESLLEDDSLLSGEPSVGRVRSEPRLACRFRLRALARLQLGAVPTKTPFRTMKSTTAGLPVPAPPAITFPRGERLYRWCAQVRPTIWLGLAGAGFGCLAVGVLGLAGF